MILIPMTRSRSSHEAAWYERSSPCSLSRAVFIRETVYPAVAPPGWWSTMTFRTHMMLVMNECAPSANF